MRVLKNTKIKAASLSIFKVCSNGLCANKAEFTAGGIFADCVMSGVKILKEDCTKKCN